MDEPLEIADEFERGEEEGLSREGGDARDDGQIIRTVPLKISLNRRTIFAHEVHVRGRPCRISDDTRYRGIVYGYKSPLVSPDCRDTVINSPL